MLGCMSVTGTEGKGPEWKAAGWAMAAITPAAQEGEAGDPEH